MKKIIYLDNAATTEIDKKVKKEINKAEKIYGNPSSIHSAGIEAKNLIEQAREKIAKILNANKNEIIFTSGGTESDNLAIKGIAQKGKHIITSQTEHPAIYETCKYLEKQGIKITYLLPDKTGKISAEKVQKAITKETILVSIIYANNETGTINPINEISKICKKHKIIFHTDACQAGLLDLDVKKLGVDMMTLNSGKIYGPKGVGLLYLKNGIKINPLIHGGGQESGIKSGTENTTGIIGFAKALEIIQKNKEKEGERIKKLSEKLLKGILEIDNTKFNGTEERIPGTINISFKKIEGESLLLMLNEKGIETSTGSACSSKSLKASRTLLAMGCTEEEAHGSIRFSIGRKTKEKDIIKTIKETKKAVEKLRKISPL
jgi:cysteine desulfurase